MISYVNHVMTLANSIIGVSVLAMPFCFKQCGIILAALVLILCSLLSRLACHFLIKSAVMSRRRNYEFLAFHAFGPMGKFLVELFIIGFLLGTCIAFFVVIGDLGPQILGKLLDKNPENIRSSFLLTTGALIVLPLGLLRNIDSLVSICTVTIGFYLCLVMKIIIESMEHIFRGDWYDNVNYWRPAGILQCLPIFSMALFCQTQLFEIYETVENVCLEKMNTIVRGAMNICTIVYLCVGFFGYVAFCTQSFSGNILLIFEPSLMSDAIKIGFVLSVIFSFPLVIFPCRASLNSLFFRRVYLHETASNYIPETRYRYLTFTIVVVSLIIGLVMPNIEFVLGLVGSTIGVMICLIFPAGFFITISTKNTNERLAAQVILFIGMWIMILGSYANLYAIEESPTTRVIVNTEKPFFPLNNIHLSDHGNNHPKIIAKVQENHAKKKENSVPGMIQVDEKQSLGVVESWQEPSIAVERPVIDNTGSDVKKTVNMTSKFEIKKISKKFKMPNKILKLDDRNLNKSEEKIITDKMINVDESKKGDENKIDDQQVNNSNGDSINVDAIKKEDSEIAAANEFAVDINKNKQLDSIDINIKKNDEIHIDEVLKENKKLKNTNENNLIKSEEKIDLNKSQVLLDLNQNQIAESQMINVPLMESRGLVLNILTNGTATVSNNLIMKNNNNNNNNNNSNMKEEQYINKMSQYPLPIALQLVNQSKDKDVSKLDAQQERNEFKNDINEAPARRDILEEHAREKRDIEDIVISSTKDQETIISVSKDIEIDNEMANYVKNKSETLINDLGADKLSIDLQSTADTIIKTNVYLTDQKFENDINLNKDLAANVDYQVIKKRDLKELKT